MSEKGEMHMAVKVGSARIDENGKAYGGKAGDQTGNEVGTQSWYLHSKGWRVFRCKDPAKAEKMAGAMEAACKNSKIGYDQYQRNTLYTQAAKVGFDVSKVTTACETDCSALIRTLLELIGVDDTPTFQRNRIANQSEHFQMVMNAAQYLDDETVTRQLCGVLGLIDDADKIIAKRKEEEIDRFTGEEDETGGTESKNAEDLNNG